MPKYCTILSFAVLCTAISACSPERPTANDAVPSLAPALACGVNMGYYPPYFLDQELASLAHGTPNNPNSGIGISTIRPGLFAYFLDEWGYDARISAFQFYRQIGLRDIVAITGFPSIRDQDSTEFCAGEKSRMFRNMYAPIWDNGENGTPVNEENPYALYIWKAATNYRGLIKIWEVWNEPDRDTGNGWLPVGQSGNWWDNAPKPCETALKAPPFYYIRALRITYEVVKTIDPNALVAVGGLGWPSFLDVVCRYTDNPENGEIDEQAFPLKGGAYFDCMSFHAYPHLNSSLREFRPERDGFVYYRHSDAAMAGIWQLKNAFKSVLDKHGYNGERFPLKNWICTEFNIPRVAVGQYIGSDAAQVNFLLKTLVTAPANGLSQMHVYSLGDETVQTDPEFAFMGMFQHLSGVKPGREKPNPAAFALKTAGILLKDAVYDPVRSMAMLLPDHVGGGAFLTPLKNYVYVLWAKTTQDQSEQAQAVYRFPASVCKGRLYACGWEYSFTAEKHEVDADNLVLDGSPMFFTQVK